LAPHNYFSATTGNVGLSGGTGSGYMRQDISYWSFNTGSGVIPYLECFQDFGNGTYRAHLGYNNLGMSTVELTPGSSDNLIAPQSLSSNLPSLFVPGRQSKI